MFVYRLSAAATLTFVMASASGTGGTGGGTGGEKGGGKDKAPQKRDFRKGKPYKTYTLAEKEKIVEMIEDGYRTCEIVRVLRVPESSVRNILEWCFGLPAGRVGRAAFAPAGRHSGFPYRYIILNYIILYTCHVV